MNLINKENFKTNLKKNFLLNPNYELVLWKGAQLHFRPSLLSETLRTACKPVVLNLWFQSKVLCLDIIVL